MALVEGNDLVTDDKALAKTFNKVLVNVVATLGIKYKTLPTVYNNMN